MTIITANFLLDDTPDLDRFNNWYSTQHVPDFLLAPGIIGGRRFYRRVEDKLHFVALYEHDESVHPRESFASPEGEHAIADFVTRFPDMGMPRIEVFHEITVGPTYQSWRTSRMPK